MESKIVELLREATDRQPRADDAATLEAAANLIERYERALVRLMEMGPGHKGDKRWIIAKEAYQYRPPIDATAQVVGDVLELEAIR